MNMEFESFIDAIRSGSGELFRRYFNEEFLERKISMMGLQCNQPCDHELCPTSLRNKTFVKGSEIGSGGFGEVYKCKGSGIDTEFAVKRVRLDEIDEKYIEGNIHNFLYKLEHRRIIRYFGAIQKKQHLCIFMEYLSEGSLKDQIKSKKGLATKYVIKYSKQILEALKFLHGIEIIHRDIKPANILIGPENNIKLADFGLSRPLMRITDQLNEARSSYDIYRFLAPEVLKQRQNLALSQRSISITGQSTIPQSSFGTVNFLAPEILQESPYTRSTDIWSVGATVINMITGKAPYENMAVGALLNKIRDTKKLEMPPNISEEMKGFIEAMLNPDPDQRPSATQLLQLKLFSEFE